MILQLDPKIQHRNRLFLGGRIFFGEVDKRKKNKRKPMMKVAQKFQGCDQTFLDLIFLLLKPW